jgi:hypothetical protein
MLTAMGSRVAVGVKATVGEADGVSDPGAGLHAAAIKINSMKGRTILEMGFIGSIIPEV